MGFGSLSIGSPFYILKKEDLILQIGTIKKIEPKQPYQASIPLAFTGINQQQLLSITISIDGKEEQFTDVPNNVEIASKGSVTFTGNKEQMLQVVDSMILNAKQELDKIPYYEKTIKQGENMLEVLNPRYAIQKEHDRSIKELEDRQLATDNKLDEILQVLKNLTNK